jgi:hypothetical protein
MPGGRHELAELLVGHCVWSNPERMKSYRVHWRLAVSIVAITRRVPHRELATGDRYKVQAAEMRSHCWRRLG